MRYIFTFLLIIILHCKNLAQNVFRLKHYNSTELIYTNLLTTKDTIVSGHNLFIDTILLKDVIYRPGEFIRRCMLLYGAARMVDTINGNIWELVAQNAARKKHAGMWSPDYFDNQILDSTRIADSLQKIKIKSLADSIRKADSLARVDSVKNSIWPTFVTRTLTTVENFFVINFNKYRKLRWLSIFEVFGVLATVFSLLLAVFVYVRPYFKPTQIITILLIGDKDVGKTTLAYTIEHPDADLNSKKKPRHTEGIFPRIYENVVKPYKRKRYKPKLINLPSNFQKKATNFDNEIFRSPIDVVVMMVSHTKENSGKEVNGAYIYDQSLSVKEYLTFTEKFRPKLLILYINKLDLLLNEHPDNVQKDARRIQTLYKSQFEDCFNAKTQWKIKYRTYFGSVYEDWYAGQLFENLLSDLFGKSAN